ncbi:unnamed protein product [Triticum turgidum subsp. durum]|uniref:Uncharacterized protein n=1 Tax=Triticum turgidum subsp. durum TaxID=4567 RepID=A0A9R0Z730_TRITD|nr:unnamed protein product [Triticum turgidum subsp. durum]
MSSTGSHFDGSSGDEEELALRIALEWSRVDMGGSSRWEDNVGRSVPTTKFRPRNPERRDSYVLDCRHGRILLGCRWYDEGEEEADEQLKEEEDDIEEDGEGEEADKEEEEYDTDEEGEEDDEDEDEGKEDDRVSKMVVWDPVSGKPNPVARS